MTNSKSNTASSSEDKRHSQENFQTRLCIQNLPKQGRFNEQRLRNLVEAPITDVKWVGRRMAIVGLETPQAAKDVIAKLHGTYCDTSKLVVEYARKPNKGGEQKEKGKRKALPKDDVSKKTDLKESKWKKEDIETVNKRKFWSNDDDDLQSDPKRPNAEPPSESILDDTMAFLRSKQTPVDNLGDDDAHEEESGKNEAEGDGPTTPSFDSTRLFLRNLPYSVTAEQVGEHFEHYGTIIDCHISYDDRGNSKGFGFIKFSAAPAAQTALQEQDGTEFYGRILSVLPARPGSTTTNEHQNASYIRTDAVLDTVASRMNVSQSAVLSVKDGLSAGDAAVRMALAETALVQENKNFLSSLGVAESSERKSRSCFLVKNLPHDTAVSELQTIFQSASTVDLAPSHTLAVIKFLDNETAKQAFKRHSYRRFKTVPLYLEWAPLANSQEDEPMPTPVTDAKADEEEIVGPTATLYVKNLNFETTEEALREHFDEFKVRSVRIPQKVSSVRGRIVNQSMGYGFVEFASREAAQKALSQRQSGTLNGHKLELQPRNEKDAPQSGQGKDKKKGKNKKLLVKNVPFQATRKELLQLFGSFGTVRNIRLPKKFDGGHRGFCFIEYVDDAEPARQANTHLYGRHLVIDYAEDESTK